MDIDFKTVKPSFTPGYDGIIPVTRSTRGASPNDVGANDLPDMTMTIPDPAIGGLPGPRGVLGWSTGFRARRIVQPLRGGIVNPPSTQLTAGGPVGFSTRTTRLADKVAALYTADVTDTPRNLAVKAAR